ncbi:vesicle transport through interaction with t-SNAREs homolog 1B-like [Lineus longissimus]|uniref:vesicle transport through interaction with t-SNAREs homolog 1B-like n=1 Tax=Lineus longissimus TaxID=88925 RepID=UPI002B4E3E44
MSSEKFENLNDDFRTVYEKIRLTVKDRIPRSSGEERKRLIRDAETQLEDAGQIVQEMESEAKRAPPRYRMDMMTTVRDCKKDLDRFSREMRRGSGGFGGSDRDNLFGGGSEFDAMETSQRAKLMQGTESLKRSTASVGRAQQIAAETDQIAVDVIDELGNQRESLERTRDRLHETDSGLVRSRKILRSMARKMMTNKLVLAVIIILEFIILGGVVYWKFFS